MEKGEHDVVGPDSLRPLDIFPMAMRLISGATANLLRAWKLAVLPLPELTEGWHDGCHCETLLLRRRGEG